MHAELYNVLAAMTLAKLSNIVSDAFSVIEENFNVKLQTTYQELFKSIRPELIEAFRIIHQEKDNLFPLFPEYVADERPSNQVSGTILLKTGCPAGNVTLQLAKENKCAIVVLTTPNLTTYFKLLSLYFNIPLIIVECNEITDDIVEVYWYDQPEMSDFND